MSAEQTPPPFYRRRRNQVAAAIVVALAVLVAAGLPYAIKYGVERKLVAMGAEKALIDDVDFNPLTGFLAVEKLRVERGGATPLAVERLSANLDPWKALGRRLFASDISVEGLDLTVRELPGGGLSYGGLTPVSEETGGRKAGRPWGLGFSGLDVTASRVVYEGGEIQSTLEITAFSAAGLKTWEPGSGTGVSFKGAVNGGLLTIDGDAAPLTEAPAITAKVKLKGLGLEPFGPLVGAGVDGLSGMLDMDSTVEAKATASGGIAFSNTGDVAVRDGGVSAAGVDLGVEKVSWKGSASWTRAMDGEGGFSASGRAEVKGASVVLPEKAMTLLAFDTLTVPNVAAGSPGKVVFDSLTIEGLRAAAPAPDGPDEGPGPVFSAGKVDVRDVAVRYPKSVAVGGVRLSDMDILIQRLGNGSVHMLGGLAPPTQAGRDGEAGNGDGEGRPDRTGMTIAVNRVEASGESVFRFNDDVTGYKAVVAFDELQVSGISNEPGMEKGHLIIEAGINEYSRLSARGTIEPFAGGLTLNINGNVRDLDLPPLTPYSRASIGYTITSGHMDSDFSLGVDGGVINGVSDVSLHNFGVTPSDEGRINQLTQELSMPLEAALKLLRDKDGTVRLEVPVEGDITSPRFELAGVMNKALGRAVKKTAIAYLKYTLQPYGTYLTVANLARYLGKAAFGVRLDPVFFEPDETGLDEKDLDYLGHVATLMKEKPEVVVKVCGFSVPGEAGRIFGGPGDGRGDGARLTPGAKERLEGLARERAEAVKDHLVAVSGVDPGRLFVCHPAIDEDAGARPRVELLI